MPAPKGPLPPPGTARLVAGGLLTGEGAIWAIVGGYYWAAGTDMGAPNRVRSFGGALLGLGVASMAVGPVLLVSGSRARRKQERWAADYALEPPRSGNGLLAAGGVITGIGVGNIVSTAVLTEVRTPFGLAWGTGQLILGTSLLIVGAVRHANYVRWRNQRRLSVAPTFAPLPGGGSFGVAGRF